MHSSFRLAFTGIILCPLQAASEALGELEDLREQLKVEQRGRRVLQGELEAGRVEQGAVQDRLQQQARELQAAIEQVGGQCAMGQGERGGVWTMLLSSVS